MRLFLMAVCSFMAMTVGCKTVGSYSSTKHTLGNVGLGEGRWTYLDLDRQQFIRMNPSSYLPVDHLLSQKSIEWVDRFHAAIVNRQPEMMLGIPKPQIIVMKKTSPDAFAAKKRNVSYLLNVALFSQGEQNAELQETQSLAFSGQGSLEHNIFPPEIKVAVDDPVSYSSWFGKVHAPCGIEKSFHIRIEWAYNKDCARESYLNRPLWSPGFVTSTAPNWLIVTSGLFGVLPNEESFAAIIAHELAHYYRAHVVKDQSKYNFCYLLNDPQHKPVQREDLQTLCGDLKLGRARGGLDAAVAAAKAGLSVYTIEQEADEIALELLAAVGIDPIRATDAWFALFEQVKDSPSAMEIPFDRCRELFKNNWQGPDGKSAVIPVGDYQDAHHSWCFRAWNTTNEINVHRYQIETPVRLDEADWNRARMSANQ